MTTVPVNDTTPRNQYTASAAQTTFVYDFFIFEAADLDVYKDQALLTLTTDYAVTGADTADGGNVVLNSGCAGGEVITINGNVAIERDVDLQQAGKFDPDEYNLEQDRNIVIMKQLRRDIDRCISLDVTSTADPQVFSSQILAVYNDLANVDLVAGSISSVNSVAGSIGNVNSVAADLANINSVAADLTNINAAANNKGFRNRIINGIFNVNNRPILSTDNSYTIDRWRLLLEAPSAATAAQLINGSPTDSGSALRLTVGSGNNNKFGIFQVLEQTDILNMRNSAITLSAKIEATAGLGNIKMAVLEFTGTADTVSGDPITSWGADGVNPTLATNWAYGSTPVNLGVSTSFATYSVTYNSTAALSNLAVLIWCDDKTSTATTDMLDISNVQLEKSPSATAYEYRPVAYERLMADKYFQSSYPSGVAPGTSETLKYNDLGFALTTSVLYANGKTNFRNTMRAAPTVTLYSTGGTSGKVRDFTGSADVTAVAAIISQYGFIVTSSAAFTANHGHGCHYTADAEL